MKTHSNHLIEHKLSHLHGMQELYNVVQVPFTWKQWSVNYKLRLHCVWHTVLRFLHNMWLLPFCWW